MSVFERIEENLVDNYSSLAGGDRVVQRWKRVLSSRWLSNFDPSPTIRNTPTVHVLSFRHIIAFICVSWRIGSPRWAS